jgi:hypothetical protein
MAAERVGNRSSVHAIVRLIGRRLMAFCAASVVLVLGLVSAATATTWEVPGDGSNTCNTGNPSCTTIQGAVSAATGGDTINVAAGTYDITSTITVNKAVTISGPTSGVAKLQGTYTPPDPALYSVFEIAASDVTIQNLEITLTSSSGLPSPDSEFSNALIRIPSSLGLSGINITGNTVYVPTQAGAMSTWGHRGITVNDNATTGTGVTISGNAIYNTRNGIVIRTNNIVTVSNNIIYNTKGGVMQYTSAQADADNRAMTNNSWNGVHNEWDIVWNTAYYVPDYQLSVLGLSGANNDAYVLDRRAADATACANLTGNRSHIFVDAASAIVAPHPARGNYNEPFQTIALGIDAVVPGGTVYVAAGTYVEQVEISKPLTLTGTGDPIIQSPVSLSLSFPTPGNVNKPVVYVHGTDNVTIEGLTVDGLGRGNANYRFVGIAYYDASGHVTNVEIKNIEDTPFSGAQHGIGLYAYSAAGTARSLEVDHVNVHDFQKGGMVYTGANLSIDVHDNSVTGAGDTAVTAQNGIQVSSGAQGDVANNTVSNVDYTGSLWGATGILAISAGPLTISGNQVNNAQMGINVDTPVTVTGNVVTGHSANDWGIVAYSGASITNNTVTNVGGGIFIMPGSTDTITVSGNSYAGFAGSPGNVALWIYGSPANASLDLGASAFGADLDYYVYLDGAAVNVDATSATFGGKLGSAMDLSELFATEDKIIDALDETGLGLVEVNANNLYVTPDSGGIQQAIDVAAAGDTIAVAPGTYNETNITVNKSLTITGDASGPCPGPGPNAPEIVGTSTGSERGFIISPGVDNVIIEGFIIRDLGVVPQTEAGGACGIWAYDTTADPTEHITVRNNAFSAIGWTHIFFYNEAQSTYNDINVTCNTVDIGVPNYEGDYGGNQYGIECTNCVNSTISDNVVSGGDIGVLLTAQTGTGRTMTAGNNTISGNTISGSGFGNICTVPWSLGGEAPTLQNISITDNHLSNSTTSIWIYSYGVVRDYSITGNDITVSNPSANGSSVYVRDVGGTSTFHNNTVVLTGTPPPSSFHGIDLGGSASGNWTIQTNALEGNSLGSASAGIRLRGSLPATSNIAVSCNRIEGWAAGVGLEALANAALLTVNNNLIAGNTLGVDASLIPGGSPVDATQDYWGCADGPGTLGCDSAIGNVLTSPYATSAPPCTYCTVDAECDNGVACDGTESCNPNTHLCTPGTPVDCSSLDDSCNVGTCTEPSGSCTATPEPDGTSCGSGLETCQAGICGATEQPNTLTLASVRLKRNTSKNGSNGLAVIQGLVNDNDTNGALMTSLASNTVTLDVSDGGEFQTTIALTGCQVNSKGTSASCKDPTTKTVATFRLKRIGYPGSYHFVYSLKVACTGLGSAETGSTQPSGPVEVILHQGSGVDRSDSLSDCQPSGKVGLRCHG